MSEISTTEVTGQTVSDLEQHATPSIPTDLSSQVEETSSAKMETVEKTETVDAGNSSEARISPCHFEMECSEAPVMEVKAGTNKKKEPKKEKIAKKRINGLIPQDLADDITNLALWEPCHTLTSLMVEGLEYIIEKYGKREKHGGKLKVGRRPKIKEGGE